MAMLNDVTYQKSTCRRRAKRTQRRFTPTSWFMCCMRSVGPTLQTEISEQLSTGLPNSAHWLMFRRYGLWKKLYKLKASFQVAKHLFLREVWDPHTSAAEDLVLPRCYSVPLGKQIRTFRVTIVPSSSGSSSPGTMLLRNAGTYSPNYTASHPACS
jgi:hypothetical protein